MASMSEITQLCRLCLIKDEVNVPIFQDVNVIDQIFLKISACLPIKVSKEDKLPKKICDACSYKLELFYDFLNTSKASEKQLRKWIDQLGAEKESSKGINPTTIILKQEIQDPAVDLSQDELSISTAAHNYSIQQQQLSYGETVEFELPQEGFININEASTVISSSRKRPAESEHGLSDDSEYDDDVGLVGSKITKMEDDEDSEIDADQTAFIDLPSGSGENDQAGPSGVGKETADAPSLTDENCILKRLIIGSSMSVTLKPNTNISYPFTGENSTLNPGNLIDWPHLQSSTVEKEPQLPDLQSEIKPNDIQQPPLKLKLKLSSKLFDKKLKWKKLKTKKARTETNDAIGESIHCDICDTTFRTNILFALHSIKHSEDGKYNCHVCKYSSASKYHFEMHVRVHEDSTGFRCEICNKAFAISTHAVEHKYFHTGEKPFQCEICGKHFMFSWFLTSHRRTQHWEIMTGTPLTKYDCTICNKHYTSSTGLKRHQLNYHNDEGIDRSVLCDICGKRLSTKEKLKFHRRIHTGYKPHVCNICFKSFTKKELLKEHERVHTGEKPYTCNYCEKAFSQRSPLTIHKRTHTGERPYVCHLCNKGFISKGVKDIHMKNCNGIEFIKS